MSIHGVVPVKKSIVHFISLASWKKKECIRFLSDLKLLLICACFENSIVILHMLGVIMLIFKDKDTNNILTLRA